MDGNVLNRREILFTGQDFIDRAVAEPEIRRLDPELYAIQPG